MKTCWSTPGKDSIPPGNYVDHPRKNEVYWKQPAPTTIIGWYQWHRWSATSGNGSAPQKKTWGAVIIMPGSDAISNEQSKWKSVFIDKYHHPMKISGVVQCQDREMGC